uniref:Uncharacterized protein n=2 Tax=Oryza brachyantha TaxID=4533 RepID=J3NBW3_ORYBR
MGMGSQSHSGTRRVHFGDSSVLEEKDRGGGGGGGVGEVAEEDEQDECSSVTSHESEAPLAQSMHSLS